MVAFWDTVLGGSARAASMFQAPWTGGGGGVQGVPGWEGSVAEAAEFYALWRVAAGGLVPGAVEVRRCFGNVGSDGRDWDMPRRSDLLVRFSLSLDLSASKSSDCAIP
jgi:hypothetical protein